VLRSLSERCLGDQCLDWDTSADSCNRTLLKVVGSDLLAHSVVRIDSKGVDLEVRVSE
jgi:hypothetical protein